MTWYKTETNTVYWLIGNEQLFELGNPSSYMATVELPNNWSVLPFRKLLITDTKLPTALYAKGGSFTYNAYIPNNYIFQPPKLINIKFPSRPSYQSLAPLVDKKFAQINDKATLKLVDPKTIALYVAGIPRLSWFEDCVELNCFNNVNNNEVQLSVFSEFLGRDFEIDFKRYQIRCLGQRWYKVIHKMIFNLSDGRLYEEDQYDRTIKSFNKIEDTLLTYYNMVTPEFILNLYKDMVPGYLVSTRCVGCQQLDVNHLILHVYRKELPFFIMLSAFDCYLTRENSIESVWQLITDLRNGKLERFVKFKEYLKGFLDYALLPQNVMHPESLRFTSVFKWQIHKIKPTHHWENSFTSPLISADSPVPYEQTTINPNTHSGEYLIMEEAYIENGSTFTDPPSVYDSLSDVEDDGA